MSLRRFRAEMFVNAHGELFAASCTDQRGRRGVGLTARTVHGNPVEHVGDSYTVERKYQWPIIKAAQRRMISAWIGNLFAKNLLPTAADCGAFVAAITAAAGDMAPVLIFTDWLEDRGESGLADQIRKSVQKAK